MIQQGMTEESMTEESMTQEGSAQAAGSPGARRARKVQVGTVTSDKRDKTITLVVERLVRHPIYEKYIRRRTKLHAHDDKNEAKVGDTVEVMSIRPLSKSKRWRLVKIVRKVEG